MVRKGALFGMVVIGIVAAVAATLVAVLFQWLPDSASKEMDRLAAVYWFATIICIVIFGVVTGWLVYAVYAFRAKPGDDTDGPPVHGHSGLEVVWTAIPAVLVVAIGIWSAVAISRNANAGANPLHIKVYAQQFAWKFTYPDDGGFVSDELVMPVDRGVEFEMTSADVIHSFWIPEMGQKQDLLPGVNTKIVVTPTRTGSFALVCTELCGAGHATMRGPVRVVSKAEFASWTKEHAEGGGGGGAAPSGQAIFASNGCGGCHAFKPAGSDGAVGPALDALTEQAEAAGATPEDFVREAIVDPNKVLADGYQPDVMPGSFGETLKPEQIDALVKYLLGKE
ncbi:MAG: cytochrome c oxidase subunit II [Gaiellales bacterium]